jgi:hypothetical protein
MLKWLKFFNNYSNHHGKLRIQLATWACGLHPAVQVFLEAPGRKRNQEKPIR